MVESLKSGDLRWRSVVSKWYLGTFCNEILGVFRCANLASKKLKKTCRKSSGIKKKPRILAESGLSWGLPDLNREPTGYESVALTIARCLKACGFEWWLFSGAPEGAPSPCVFYAASTLHRVRTVCFSPRYSLWSFTVPLTLKKSQTSPSMPFCVFHTSLLWFSSSKV